MLVVNKSVILKMLPFDNKSSCQVVLDMPRNAAWSNGPGPERDGRVSVDGRGGEPNFQGYAGTAGADQFNGGGASVLLRKAAHLGDIR